MTATAIRSRLPTRSASRIGLCLAPVLAVAVVNFTVGLGASSLFVDEAFSWVVSAHPISDLYSQVKASEVAPPGYYAFMHLWLHLTSSNSEAAIRVPSVVAGVALVAACAWLGGMLGGPLAAPLAGLLVAVSPLAASYAQEVRAYIFVMLASTLAVAATVAADRDRTHQERWLVASGVACVCAIWLHYTCLPVIAVLLAWVLTRRQLTSRFRAGYALAVLAAQALVTPLMLHQLSTPNAGAQRYSHFTLTNVLDVLGSALDGRYPSHRGAALLAALAIVAAAVRLAYARRLASVRHLVVIACVLPPLMLIAVTLAGKPVLISRYCTVAAPFGLVALGVAAARGAWAWRAALLALAIAACIGSWMFHEPRSRYPAIGAAFHAAGSHWHAGDRLVLGPGIDPSLSSEPLWTYYTDRYLPAGVQPIVEPSHDRLIALLSSGRRLWLIGNAPVAPQSLDRLLAPLHDRVAQTIAFPGDERVQLTLITRAEASRARPALLLS